MLKAGIWDLGGVLFTNGTKSFIKNISARYGLDAQLVMDVMDGDLGSQYRENKITKDEFWAKALEKLKINANAEQLSTEWINEYHLIEGTRDIILELRKSIPQYFLSDNVRERVESINQNTGFLKWFDGGIFSHEAGVRKPNPMIYKLVMQKAEVKPEEAFFVDDKETSLVPAREMGLKSILFTNPKTCRMELIRLGLPL